MSAGAASGTQDFLPRPLLGGVGEAGGCKRMTELGAMIWTGSPELTGEEDKQGERTESGDTLDDGGLGDGGGSSIKHF